MLINKFMKILKEKYALIAIFLLMFLLTFILPRYGDEYVYSFVFKTEKRTKNIIDITYSTYNMYMNWSGRIIPNFLQNLFLLFGKFSYSIFNALIFVTIIRQSLLLLEKYDKKIKFSNFDYLILFSLNWFLIPVFTQDYIGLASSISYSWPLCFLLLYMNYLESIFGREKVPNKIIIYSFLIGLTNEVVIIFINILLLFKILQYKKINYKILLSLWIGSAIEIFSPGNFVRKFSSETQRNITTLFERYSQFFKMAHTMLILKILIFLLLLFIIKYYLYEKKKKYIPLDMIITSSITLVLMIIIMPRNKPRAYLVPFYFFILSIFYFLKLLYTDNRYILYFSKFSICIMLFISLCNIIPYYFLTVRRLDNERQKMMKYYIENNLKEVVFYENDSILNKMDSSHRAYEMLFLSPEVFTNSYFSKYYGFHKVYAIPRESKLFIIEFETGSKLDKIKINLDQGKRIASNNFQVDNMFLLTIPERVKEIEIEGEGFRIKKLKIIEIYKGITLDINDDIRKIGLI